jgi:hypothetical protein
MDHGDPAEAIDLALHEATTQAVPVESSDLAGFHDHLPHRQRHAHEPLRVEEIVQKHVDRAGWQAIEPIVTVPIHGRCRGHLEPQRSCHHRDRGFGRGVRHVHMAGDRTPW